jgi:hypothetical protein
MRDFLKDYGAAIGPGLAFLLGLLTLFVKYGIDRCLGRRNTRRRLRDILEMMRGLPPPPFQGPIDALSNVTFMLPNATNMLAFYDQLAAVESAMGAIDNAVHEDGEADTIMLFERMKWHLDTILREREHFHKVGTGTDIPGEDNFVNVHSSWQAFVETDATANAPLHYEMAQNPSS